MENQIIRHNLKYHQVVPNIVLSMTCESYPFSVPSTRTWSSTVCAEEFPTPLEMSPWIASAQTDANLSAHLHRLPTPPPYLRQMRLLPGRGRRCWVLDEAVASQGRRCWVANNAASCPWHTSCKSPRARILVLGTSGAHWPARWPQFVLTEHAFKS